MARTPAITSRPYDENGAETWERVFGKKDAPVTPPSEEKSEETPQ